MSSGLTIRLFLIAAAVLMLASCSSSVRFTSEKTRNKIKIDAENQGKAERGIASYYSDEFNGRRTASGEIFDNEAMSAAHKTLSFGTVVLVKNLENGRQAAVKINDRGPFIKGRIIDLSRAAARRLGMLDKGITEVEIVVIKEP